MSVRQRHVALCHAAADADARLTLPPVREPIDWGCIERLSEYAAMRRAEVGEERWHELEREWE